MTAIFYLQIHLMDVKTAFLNGDINEEIYMDQPECYIEATKKIKYVNLLNPYMARNRHQSNDMNLHD